MGLEESARNAAQAQVSEAEAEVARLTNELKKAQQDLDGANAAGQLLDAATKIPVVGGLAEGVRDNTTVDAAQAKANVDQLTSELTNAQNRLELARKAQAAVGSVADAANQAKEAWREATDGD